MSFFACIQENFTCPFSLMNFTTPYRWRGIFTLPEGVYTIKTTYEGKTKIQTITFTPPNQQIAVVIDFEM
jgi:hypothetical protein